MMVDNILHIWWLGKEDPSNPEYQDTQGMIDLEYESDGMYASHL